MPAGQLYDICTVTYGPWLPIGVMKFFALAGERKRGEMHVTYGPWYPVDSFMFVCRQRRLKGHRTVSCRAQAVNEVRTAKQRSLVFGVVKKAAAKFLCKSKEFNFLNSLFKGRWSTR